MNYTQRLAEAKLVPSVGSVGDSYDNALAETINGLYKAEVIWRQRSWPSVSAVEMATLRWVDWYNNHRLFGPRSEEHTSELQSLMRISYAVFCLQKTNNNNTSITTTLNRQRIK